MLMGPLRLSAYSPDLGLAHQRAGHGVERLHALHLEHCADLQVVLQVGAHAGQVHLHLHAVLAQQRGGADARQLQQLGEPTRLRSGSPHPLRGP